MRAFLDFSLYGWGWAVDMSRPYALLASLWAVAIFAGTILPLRVPPWTLFPHSDKLAHFIEYAVLTFLVYAAFTHSPKRELSRRAVIFSALICISYGAALESYQAFLPLRECSFLDFVANCAGVVCIAVYERKLRG